MNTSVKIILLLLFFAIIFVVEAFAQSNPLYEHHNRLKWLLWHFDDACFKCGAWYVGAFGTALGAFRHRDLIPFDDDIDVCMTRDDLEILNKHLLSDKHTAFTLRQYGPSNSGMYRFQWNS